MIIKIVKTEAFGIQVIFLCYSPALGDLLALEKILEFK